MVGFNPDLKNSAGTDNNLITSINTSTSDQCHFVVAGFTSGCLTRFLCHPLDVLKIRFQLQIEPISRDSAVSKYRTVGQTFQCIIREESMYALWKGHVSAQLLSGIYGKLI